MYDYLDLRSYVDSYVEDLKEALARLDRERIEAVVEAFARAWQEGRGIFVIGNGGSAALASHMANDLTKLTSVPGQPRVRALSLCDNIPLITAWANDASYDLVFAEQMRSFCGPGDLLVVISGSGNSRNILRALELARDLEMTTIGFTGAQGGQVAGMVDICVRAPAGPIYQQEDIHLVLNHMVASALKQRIAAAA